MRYLKKKATLFSFLVIVFFATFAGSCDGSDEDESRRADTALRENNFSKAEALYPVPTDLTNFPMRESLVEMTRRQDMTNHPWYVYIYDFEGDPLGYYVGRTYPQSMCNFLSSSEKLTDIPHDGDSAPDFVLTAPSLDGIYYGGGGSSAACQSMFFFDIQTDAMYTFSANTWIASDKPLSTFDGPALGETSVDDIEGDPSVITTPEPQTPAPIVTPTEQPE